MTKQELVDKCLEEKKRIDTLLEEGNSEFDFYEHINQYVKTSNVYEYTKIEPGNLLLAYFNALKTENDFETNEDYLYVLMDTINQLDMQKTIKLHKQITSFLDNERLISMFEDPNFDIEKKQNYLVTKFFKRLFKTKELREYDLFDILKITKLYYEDFDKIDEALKYVETLYKFTDQYSENIDDLEEYGLFITDKDQKKEIINKTKIIREHHKKLFSENKSTTRRLQKESINYSNFIEIINDEFKKDEIITYEELIKKIPSDEIKLDFLKMVYQHNIEEYTKTKKTYDSLNDNSYLKYISLLKDYNINKEEFNLSKIMNNSYEETKELINILDKLKLPKNILIKALENSNINHIIYIKELIDKGIINTNTLINYSDILKVDSSEIISLNKNLETFKRFNINPANLVNNPEVLINNDFLEANINILEDYYLIDLVKSKSNYHYLSEENLSKKIDTFLELGFEKYLIEDITLLNENNLERLYILKSINIPINSKEELLDVLRNKDFFIPDSKTDEYLPNDSKYYMDDETDININDLSKHSDGLRTYNINGIFLSKNKVKRNINNNLPVFQALITDNPLTSEEIEIIKKEFNKSKAL